MLRQKLLHTLVDRRSFNKLCSSKLPTTVIPPYQINVPSTLIGVKWEVLVNVYIHDHIEQPVSQYCMKTTCPSIVLMLVLIQFKTTKGFFHQIVYHGFYSYLFVCSGLYVAVCYIFWIHWQWSYCPCMRFFTLMAFHQRRVFGCLQNSGTLHDYVIHDSKFVFLRTALRHGLLITYLWNAQHSWCGGAHFESFNLLHVLGACFERSECSRRRLEHFF